MRTELLFAAAALTSAALMVIILVAFLDARLDAPTMGLAMAGAALIYALRGLFSMVQALAQPAVESAIRAEGGRARAELRDEKKRVLRAIKELDFDYGVGKLSQADYEGLRANYQMRAISVMRDLDDSGKLHPDLQAELERKSRGEAPEERAEDAAPEPSAEQAPKEEATDETDAAAASFATCGHCDGKNDLDAKFCKHCGKSQEEDRE